MLESGEEITAANAAVVSGKLAQITAGFLYHDLVPGGEYAAGERKWDVLHKMKLDKLEDIIEVLTVVECWYSTDSKLSWRS